MLTVKPQLNLTHAREYFREHLCVGDYYTASHRVTGEWFGQGAASLGLRGPVQEEAFLRLCEGSHPKTGEWLTQRRNTFRQRSDGCAVANRRVFYDFTLSPPKSVSVMGLIQDERIEALHTQAVQKAMAELEQFAGARVRRNRERSERPTGNVVGATFRHETSREFDPHLHTHCVIFNATFDATESRWKALEVHAMYGAQKFIEAYYFHELAKGLRQLGYGIENEGRAFKIPGVSADLCQRFSKRHQEIDRETDRRLRTGEWRGSLADLREHVARDVRRRKRPDSTATRLRPQWAGQMNAAERHELTALVPQGPKRAVPGDAKEAVAWADEHLFERRAIIREPELLAAALTRGRGEGFDLPALREAIAGRGYIREASTDRLTSRDVLACELELVVAAHDGRKRYAPFHANFVPSVRLTAEQTRALRQLLDSRDLVTLFRGGAGTGKSFTLLELQRGLLAANHPVVVLALQRQQVRDLQADGLPAETLARFLQTSALSRGAVVIVDEAGQVGGRDLRALLRLVLAHGSRLILSGDTRQHGAVAVSDALRALETQARLKPAVLTQIRRQDPARGRTARERGFIRRYRTAVKAASRGRTGESFDRLDALGCIRELVPTERRAALAAEYLAALGKKESALVVAPTREEVRQVNEAVREALRGEGRLSGEQMLDCCRPVDLTAAEKREPRSYAAGQRAFFLQRYGRFAKGDLCEIVGATARGVVIVKHGRRSTLSFRYASRIVVAVTEKMAVAAGDRLQLKFNGVSREDQPLHNGELVTVRALHADGSIRVRSDDGRSKILASSQRLLVRGFAVTSYGSQGKTVDNVLVADAGNAAAASANQWYVSVSRGRKGVLVFTSDKAALREQVERLDTARLALELKPTDGWRWDTPRLRELALTAIRQQQHHAAVVRSRPHEGLRQVA